jgi:hypothetical protein
MFFSATDRQSLAAIDAKLDTVLAALARMEQRETTMAATLDDCLAETTRGTTIEASLETLLRGLEAQVLAANGNPAKIQAIFDAMKQRNDAAAAAIVANTAP